MHKFPKKTGLNGRLNTVSCLCQPAIVINLRRATRCVAVTSVTRCYREAELEEVLTTYTKLNKSASIFLGSNVKTSSSCIKTPSSCPSQQQQLPSRTPTAVATTIGGSTAQLSADGRKESGTIGAGRRASHDSGAGGKTTKGLCKY